MCENCKDNEINEIDEYSQELTEDFVSESYDNSFLPPYEIPFEYYDIDKFLKGVEEYSELAGKLAALINVGIHPSEALGYIMNKENIEHNLEVAKINAETNVKMSENQIVNFEKNQI